MSDYERYGDYNDDPDEERGPAKSRWWVIGVRLLRAAIICMLFGVCGILIFRMVSSGYYPDEIERLRYTDALRTYAASHELYAETQGIRVPFGDELILNGDDGRLVQSESRFGFYYADNLIVVRDAGHLQLSVRINKNDVKNIAAKYGLSDLAFAPDAFTFTLYDNRNVSSDSLKLEMGTGGVYTPTLIETDDALMYHYIKICFDGIDFQDVKWMRLDITPRGADTTHPDYKQLGICVYENNENEAQFKEYKLKKSEKLS